MHSTFYKTLQVISFDITFSMFNTGGYQSCSQAPYDVFLWVLGTRLGRSSTVFLVSYKCMYVLYWVMSGIYWWVSKIKEEVWGMVHDRTPGVRPGGSVERVDKWVSCDLVNPQCLSQQVMKELPNLRSFFTASCRVSENLPVNVCVVLSPNEGHPPLQCVWHVLAIFMHL